MLLDREEAAGLARGALDRGPVERLQRVYVENARRDAVGAEGLAHREHRTDAAAGRDEGQVPPLPYGDRLAHPELGLVAVERREEAEPDVDRPLGRGGRADGTQALVRIGR